MLSPQSRALRLAATLAMILMLLLFNAWFLHFNFERVAEQEALVTHTDQVLGELDDSLSSAKDIQAGTRGFLIAGDDRFLEHLHDANVRAEVHADLVRKMTIDNPAQTANSDVLIGSLQKLIDLNQKLIDDRQSGRRNPIVERQSLIDDKGMMDALRDHVQKMREMEQRILIIRSEDAKRSKYLFFWSLVLTTLLSAGVITVTFRQVRLNQVRAERDATEKAYRARMQENTAELAKSIAGDLSLDQAAREVQSFSREGLKFWRLIFLYPIPAALGS